MARGFGIGLLELIIIAAVVFIPLLIIVIGVLLATTKSKSRSGVFRPCPKCDYHNPDSANFCQQCGASLSA